jgi:alpha-tubulin suppressor-like RCC1 family protein
VFSAVCLNGFVYCCGENGFGQLGTVGIRSRLVFSQVQPSVKTEYKDTPVDPPSTKYYKKRWYEKIFYATIQLDSGYLNGPSYETAIPTTKILTQAPAPVAIVSVVCGDQHCVALGCDGSLIGWGKNSHAQVGVPADVHLISKPTVISTSATFIMVAAGGNSSFALGDLQIYCPSYHFIPLNIWENFSLL